MDTTCRLLSLPFEIREIIWQFSALTEGAQGLMTCCRQTRVEFSPHYQLPHLPDDVLELRKLKILVDSTYDGGIWLRLHYTWKQNGHVWNAADAVQDMESSPILWRLLNRTKIHEIIVILRAPRRGYFVGAFMMMFAKMNDVYHFIAGVSEKCRKLQREYEDLGRITIKFTTESVRPGQSADEITNFWEWQASKILQDPLRKYLKHAGKMPYFYEYFLILPGRVLPIAPTIEYDTWPRSHVYREYQLPAPGSVTYWTRRVFEERLPDLQKHIATLAARNLTTWNSRVYDAGRGNRNKAFPEHITWEHINYDTTSLMCRYQFLLDNLEGPVGGCLDMLRLHRFKTMDARSPSNCFARFEWTARKNSGGLAGASSKINHRLRTIFDPCATEDIRSLRSTCPHLRAVSWATDSSNTATESLSRSRWLDHYPDGIRYHWNGQNLVEWCLRWEAKKGRYRGRGGRWKEDRLERLTRRWECMGCCRESVHYMSELASSFERRRLRCLNCLSKISDFLGENSIYRPVLMRRECTRRCSANGHEDCGYRMLACDYRRWMSNLRPKYSTVDEEDLGAICIEYSVEALCNPS